MRLRTKQCASCQTAASVLFRVRSNSAEPWIFVCEACLLSLKENNPHYIYGGTWKAKKASRK